MRALALCGCVTLAGCAALRLEVVPLPSANCPQSAVVPMLAPYRAPGRDPALFAVVARFAELNGVAAPPMTRGPFTSAAPTLADVQGHRRASQRADASVQRVNAFLLAITPGATEELVTYADNGDVSIEAAQAAIDFRQEAAAAAAISIQADVGVRSALLRGAANAPGPSPRLKAAVADPKYDRARHLMRAVQSGGDDVLLTFSAWQAAAAMSDAAMARTRGSPDLAAKVADAAEKLQDFNAARFLRTYARAYLRNGRVFQAELEIDEFVNEAMTPIAGLPQVPDDIKAALREALKQTFGKLCRSTPNKPDKCFLNGALGDAKFVTRSGDTIQFKGVSLAIGFNDHLQTTWDYPRSTEFAPQLVRVVIEALFDAVENGRVPAVATATACTSSPPLFPATYCVAAKPPAPSAKAASSPPPTLQDVIVSVDNIGSRADSLATVVAGEVIRGISYLSLNNEALARSLENFLGVTSRKIAERAAWHRAVEEGCYSTTPNLVVDVVKD